MPVQRHSFRPLAATALLVVSTWAAADPTVLTFDDLTTTGAVPAQYGGLDWSSSTWLAFDAPQQPYAAHSGAWRATADFGSSDADTTLRFLTPSVFDGAWFSGYSDATVTVQMYLGGALVATSSTLAPNGTPAFLASGYGGLVDRLVFSSPQQSYYAMDDFTFTTAVPEPHAWLLTAGGLAWLGLNVRRTARR